MMKFTLTLISLLLIFLVGITIWFLSASPNCSFERLHMLYDPEDAEFDAVSMYKNKDYKFIGIADGIAPTRPGFDGIEITKCILVETDWDLFWVGADSGICRNHEALLEKAYRYSETFNLKMVSLLREEQAYMCNSEMKIRR